MLSQGTPFRMLTSRFLNKRFKSVIYIWFRYINLSYNFIHRQKRRLFLLYSFFPSFCNLLSFCGILKVLKCRISCKFCSRMLLPKIHFLIIFNLKKSFVNFHFTVFHLFIKVKNLTSHLL